MTGSARIIGFAGATLTAIRDALRRLRQLGIDRHVDITQVMQIQFNHHPGQRMLEIARHHVGVDPRQEQIDRRLAAAEQTPRAALHRAPTRTPKPPALHTCSRPARPRPPRLQKRSPCPYEHFARQSRLRFLSRTHRQTARSTSGFFSEAPQATCQPHWWPWPSTMPNGCAPTQWPARIEPRRVDDPGDPDHAGSPTPRQCRPSPALTAGNDVERSRPHAARGRFPAAAPIRDPSQRIDCRARARL